MLAACFSGSISVVLHFCESLKSPDSYLASPRSPKSQYSTISSSGLSSNAKCVISLGRSRQRGELLLLSKLKCQYYCWQCKMNILTIVNLVPHKICTLNRMIGSIYYYYFFRVNQKTNKLVTLPKKILSLLYILKENKLADPTFQTKQLAEIVC